MKVTKPLAFIMATAALLGSSVVLHATESDDRIETSFKQSYVYKTYLKDEHIKISSKDGVVTLTGDVFNESHKPMAADTAEGLPGVKSVDNELKISGDQPAEHSDSWIAMKVKSALMFHRNVNASGTTVDVKDGIVTLRGEAINPAQKELTGEYAKDIENVKEVHNEMTIAKVQSPVAPTLGENIDDSSITAQVKAALLTHRSTGLLRTKVETNAGVVTLGGQARNGAEKDLVTKLVGDVNGVKSVVNNMTIAAPVATN